jgi:lauroyl/myristoyl acyltransferase
MAAFHTATVKFSSIFRRFNIHGDFWWRYVMFGARWCPWWLEPLMVFSFTVFFFLVLNTARNCVAANLRVLLGCGWLSSQLRVFVVFWNYAWTLADEMHVKLGEDVISWEVDGMSHLQELESAQRGAILMTAHMGNYDVAAPVFAPRFKQKVHMVRTPERQKENQEFQHNLRAKSGAFTVHYNEPGSMLGVELAKCLGEGDVVAIQGDRILFDVSPITVQFDEHRTWQLPRGPFMLALVAGARIHPMFIMRTGYRQYRIQAREPIELDRSREARATAQQIAAQQWSNVLKKVIVQHWSNWFVFERVFGTEGRADS